MPITGLESGLPALVVKLVPVGPGYLNGGGNGPKGSVFTVALLSVAGLILLLPRSHRRNDPPRPAHQPYRFVAAQSPVPIGRVDVLWRGDTGENR